MSEKCTHGVRYGTLCAWCGEDLGEQNQGLKVMPQSRSITFSEYEASQITSNHLKEIKAKGKLCILIHIDQVIIDSKVIGNENFDIPKGLEDQFFFTNTSPKRVVRTRPFLKEFLVNLSSKYEFRFFSLEPEDFVNDVIQHIDPESKFFEGQIQSKNIFHVDDAIILDVSSDNWRDSTNLPVCAVVEIIPFVPLGSALRAPMFPLLPSISNQYFTNREDKILPSLIDFFESIHSKFFSEDDMTVYDSIFSTSSQILKDCSICSHELADPLSSTKQDEFRKFFLKYGARFYPSFTSSCTHVIASSKNSPDIEQAVEYKGVYIVTFEWLIDSCIHFKRSNEKDYQVTGVASPTNGLKLLEKSLPDRDLSYSEFDQILSGTSDTSDSDEEEEEESLISEAEASASVSRDDDMD